MGTIFVLLFTAFIACIYNTVKLMQFNEVLSTFTAIYVLMIYCLSVSIILIYIGQESARKNKKGDSIR